MTCRLNNISSIQCIDQMICKDAPSFASNADYLKSLKDLNFWRARVNEVLNRHGLIDVEQNIEAGYNGTYPVFLVGNYVVKFFGHIPTWQDVYTIECAAHEILASDETVLAPKILAKGQLFSNIEACWPYTITTRLSGKSWLETDLSFQEKLCIATELGYQLKRIHNLPTNNQLEHEDAWLSLNLTNAAKKSVLPLHLIRQIDNFIAKLHPFDRVFVNGDIVANHIFIEDGHLSGIIDWGDATVTDRHYELGKLLDAFEGDKTLLRALLDAADWPVTKNFPKQALGLALYRQAVGLTQHGSFDVFYKLPKILPLEDIVTLDKLAIVLFDI